ncbi:MULTISPECIES: hypothetical protein [unclassified Myroides]|uniref:hypothetical protein n=1 Tax=unclassified Myroides TaxID=2642485 RepID=UPI003D2F7F22
MTATKQQKLAIRKNCNFKEDIKEEFVQWATGSNEKTSLNDLTFEQANRILLAQGDKSAMHDEWEKFDSKNKQHTTILSLLHQLDIVTELRGRNVADMKRFGEWLKSDRSPVKKPLSKMNKFEVSKIVYALEQIIKKKWK